MKPTSLLLSLILLLLVVNQAPAQSEPYLPFEYVIHISVDGLRGDFLAERLDNDTENLYNNFERLRQEGVSTFQSRTDDMVTLTIPNHTSMLTGRPVARLGIYPETLYHGYAQNVDPAPEDTLHNKGNPLVDYIASTFDVAHDYGLRTALFTGKSKFVLFEQSYNGENGMPDEIGENNGRSKIDQFVFEHETAVLVEQFITEMEDQPYHYTFFHFRDPDSEGHGHGWGTEEWDKSVQDVDLYLGQILEFVENNETLNGRTAIILTADHGGLYSAHSKASIAENYTIPAFIWSPGNIPAHTDLYDFYADSFANPGTERVFINEKPQAFRNGSTGNLALHFLGLPPVPGAMLDSPYFITHCKIEAGQSYDFGLTQAQVDVVKVGKDGCASVAFVDRAEADYWRVIPHGDGFELTLTLPYDSQVVSSPEICPLTDQDGLDCLADKVSETAVTRNGITQQSDWTVQQTPTKINSIFIALLFLAFLILGAFYWMRKRSHHQQS